MSKRLKSSMPENIKLFSNLTFLKRPPNILLIWVMAVLLLIGLRVYKAHNTGIIHDEYWTSRDFCKNIQTPMTLYTSTNNHILNSLSIVLLKPLVGHYEHYIRIHTVFWGALFCVAVAWILWGVLQSSILRFLFLLIILLNWFVFDLSYLARGYAIAMGIVFISIAAYVRCLSQNDKHRLDGWLMTTLFVVMNFIAMGSMLSSLSIVVGINGLYVAMLLVHAKRQGRAVIIRRIFQVVTLIAGSGLSIYLLYFRVLSEVRQLSEAFEREPFFDYIKKVLWDPFIRLNGMQPGRMIFERHVYLVTLFLLAVCLGVCLIFLFMRIKSNKSDLLQMQPSTFILLLTGCVFLMKVIQYNVLGMSLGMPRNSIFFLVLVLLSGGIVIDRAVCLLSRTKIVSNMLSIVGIGMLGFLIYANLPSLKAVDTRGYDWGKQSAVGPLIHRLHQIDPQETWHLNIDGYADCLSGPVRYYEQFGYKVKRAEKGKGDVYIVREHPVKPHTIYLDYDYFLNFHCCVIVNPEAFRDKPIIYQIGPVAETSPMQR